MTMIDFKVGNLKPGDYIEWIYECDQFRIIPDDKIWSSPEGRWITAGDTMIVISVVGEELTFLSFSDGLFMMTLSDITTKKTFQSNEYVLPRLLHRNTRKRQKTITL